MNKNDLLDEIRIGWVSNYDEDFNVFERYFYSLKCYLCVLFGKDVKHKHWSEIANDLVLVVVANFNIEDYQSIDFYGKQWDELAVGRGLFKNWFYEFYDNSNV
jgi:hypothetical protein